jgi:hypothetical protein
MGKGTQRALTVGGVAGALVLAVIGPAGASAQQRSSVTSVRRDAAVTTGGLGHSTGSPSTSGVQVASAPTGPGAPSGGWYVAFADGFGGTLQNRATGNTAGDDRNWLFDGGSSGTTPGFNSDEIEVFNPSKISEHADGLHETCTYTPGIAGGTPSKNYTCGYVMTTGDTTPATGFAWMPGGGETWAFETVAKFAPQFDGGVQNGGNDEGWWASGGPPIGSWKDEFDYFEHWGYGSIPSLTGDVWAYQTSPFHNVGISLRLSRICGCDPSAAFHKYTTVINPDESFSWYMDGTLIGTHATPPMTPLRVWMKLILSYGLRAPSPNPDPVPGFKSGSRDLAIRSVAVYQDSSHAGLDIQNGTIAPGTAIG